MDSSYTLRRLETSNDVNIDRECLEELCTMICIGIEEYIRGFEVDFGARVVVGVLKRTSDAAVLILGHRALALILDSVPRSCPKVIAAGAIPLLITALQNSEHSPELAEEVLKSLEKISIDDPKAIASIPGSVQSVITNMDFQPSRLHKTAVSILSNICRRMAIPPPPVPVPVNTNTGNTGKKWKKGKNTAPPPSPPPQQASNEEKMLTQEILPPLLKLLENSFNNGNHDVVERVCVCIANVADVRSSGNKSASPGVEYLVQVGLPKLLQHMLCRPDISNEQFSKALDLVLKLTGLLITAHPDKVIPEFVQGDIGLLLNSIALLLLPDTTNYSLALSSPFKTSKRPASTQGGPATTSVSSDYSSSLLYLIQVILPPLPDGTLCCPSSRMVPVHAWSWEDDYHNFSFYESTSSQTLEAAYIERKSSVELNVHGSIYLVDFDTMKQTNRNTRASRNIARQPLPHSYRRAQGTAVKSYNIQPKLRDALLDILLPTLMRRSSLEHDAMTRLWCLELVSQLICMIAQSKDTSSQLKNAALALAGQLTEVIKPSENQNIVDLAFFMVDTIVKANVGTVFSRVGLVNSIKVYVEKAECTSELKDRATKLIELLDNQHQEHTTESVKGLDSLLKKDKNGSHMKVLNDLFQKLSTSQISTFEFINSGITDILLKYIYTENGLNNITKAAQICPSGISFLVKQLHASILATDLPIHSPSFQSENVLRQCGSVRDCLRKIGNRVFKLKIINGDVPSEESKPKDKEAPPKGKRKRGKEARTQNTETSSNSTKVSSSSPTPNGPSVRVDPLVTLGCVERFICHYLVSQQGASVLTGSMPDEDSDTGDSEHLALLMEEEDVYDSVSDEEDDFGEDEDEFDDEDDYEDGVDEVEYERFTDLLMGLDAEEAAILQRVRQSGSSRNTEPKSETSDHKHQRYYLWMSGVGRLTLGMPLFEAIVKHCKTQGYEECLFGADRVFSAPNVTKISEETEEQRMLKEDIIQGMIMRGGGVFMGRHSRGRGRGFRGRGMPNRSESPKFTGKSTPLPAALQATKSFWDKHYTIYFTTTPSPPTCLIDQIPTSEERPSLYWANSDVPNFTELNSDLQLLIILRQCISNGLNKDEFINHQLTGRVMQCLASNAPLVALMGSSGLPSWCLQFVTNAPFLFPLSARREFLNYVGFSALRSLYTYLKSVPHICNPRAEVHFDHKTVKAKINRESILKDGNKLLLEHAFHRMPLDIMYHNEVGTGLGPTLEFFTLVCQQLQLKDMGLWINDGKYGRPIPETSDDAVLYNWAWSVEDLKEYFTSPFGLFPSTDVEAGSPHSQRRVQLFSMLGRFIGRALLDGRLLNLHFPPLLFALLLDWRLALDGKLPLQLSHLAEVEPNVAKSLHSMKSCTPQELDEMEIYFHIPGNENHPLIENGQQVRVTKDNVEEYIRLVCQHILAKSQTQFLQFVSEGLQEVVPLHILKVFYPDELDQVICGQPDEGSSLWTREELLASIICDHGYSMESIEIQYLVDVLCDDLTLEQQRLFLTFLTGCPRLPIGGVAAISPKITVVRKGDSNTVASDSDGVNELPSCNTCFHYLKLPSYASRDILREKLILAIKEGQCAFTLS